MIRACLVLALATCAFAGYVGTYGVPAYGAYHAPLTAAVSTVHHAPAVATVAHGVGYPAYGYGFGHYGLGYGLGGLGYGYGLGGLGYGYGVFKK
ncbi:uncharacterized protein LOC144146951 [Haemaphysalis longicornis]